MEAKKAFMSANAITRGQFLIVIFSPKLKLIIREHLEKIQGKITISILTIIYNFMN